MCSCPPQFVVWSILFFYWYGTYVASFLRCFSSDQWYIFVPEFIVFTLIWLLTVASLAMATFTAPAPIPSMFHIPLDVWAWTHSSKSTSATSPSYGRSGSLHDRVDEWAEANSLPYSTTSERRTARYKPCFVCRVVKPPRAHHCSHCNRCILRMDHHCPIIGTCVHRDNHRYFLQFLFWAAVLCAFAAATMLPTLVVRLPDMGSNTQKSVDWIVCFIGAGTAFMFGITLVVFQANLCCDLLQNRTTLEERLSERRSGGYSEDHDLGSRCANFQSIFGRPGPAWLLPIQANLPNEFDVTDSTMA